MSILLRTNKLKQIFTKLNCTLIQNKQISTTPQRNALNWSRRAKGTIETLKLKDNIPAGYELVYRAPLEKYLKWAKNTSTATAALIAALAIFKYTNEKYMLPGRREIVLSGLVSDEEDIWYFAVGFIAINIALRVFVHKYPLRIYRNAKDYLAIYDSQIPFIGGKHQFQKGQVHVISNFFNPWKRITYRVGGRSSILLADYFKTPADFNEMF